MSRPAEKPKSGWIIRLAVFVLLIAAAWFGIGYLIRPVAVTATAVRATAVRAVPGSVEVKAEFIQELKSEVGGRVADSALDIDKRVRQGDVLVQLDTGDVDLDIQRISDELEAARRRAEVGSTLKADVENMKVDIENHERLARSGSYAQSELEKEKRTLQQLIQRMELEEVNLRLSVQTLETNLQAKQREKAKMTITSPLEGVITDVLARPGDLIGSNSPIAKIMTTTRSVEGKLSEEHFAVVKRGQRATVRFLTYGKDQYDARVSELRPTADAATQRYTVLLDVHLPEGRTLAPGLTGEVSIVIAERPNAVIVPRRAVVGGRVFVVAGGKVEMRSVETGYESLAQMEILKGVDEGETVILEQQDRFRPGDRVRIGAAQE